MHPVTWRLWAQGARDGLGLTWLGRDNRRARCQVGFDITWRRSRPELAAGLCASSGFGNLVCKGEAGYFGGDHAEWWGPCRTDVKVWLGSYQSISDTTALRPRIHIFTALRCCFAAGSDKDWPRHEAGATSCAQAIQTILFCPAASCSRYIRASKREPIIGGDAETLPSFELQLPARIPLVESPRHVWRPDPSTSGRSVRNPTVFIR